MNTLTGTPTTSTARKGLRLAALVLIAAIGAGACGGGDDTNAASKEEEFSGSIRIDGSSTVAPLSEAAAELFQEEHPGVRVTVGTSGTGGGFEKFCRGETDISDASRPIKQTEKDACASASIAYEEITVALDGLSVIINPKNTWATCLTVAQLKKIWGPSSTIDNWKDVDPKFPDKELKLFGAGTDSGTFDYFTEAIVGKEGESRTDYNATEDDNVTVNGVADPRSEGALGYLGLSYVEESKGEVVAAEIDNGSGCVAASVKTVQDGSYKPLGRPLFVYPSATALGRPEVQAFLEFYLENSDAIAEQALFVPLTAAQRTTAQEKLEKLIGGA